MIDQYKTQVDVINSTSDSILANSRQLGINIYNSLLSNFISQIDALKKTFNLNQTRFNSVQQTINSQIIYEIKNEENDITTRTSSIYNNINQGNELYDDKFVDFMDTNYLLLKDELLLYQDIITDTLIDSTSSDDIIKNIDTHLHATITLTNTISTDIITNLTTLNTSAKADATTL